MTNTPNDRFPIDVHLAADVCALSIYNEFGSYVDAHDNYPEIVISDLIGDAVMAIMRHHADAISFPSPEDENAVSNFFFAVRELRMLITDKWIKRS